MTLAGKATALTLGTGGTALLGCYVGGVFGTQDDIPWSSLADDNNFTATDGTVGKEYGQYLTGTDASNEPWWKHIHSKWQEDTKTNSSDHFGTGKVTLAYSTTVPTALNKVCEEAYKKNLTSDASFDYTPPITSSSEEKHKLAADILKYCSPLGQLPATIKTNDTTYTTGNPIGKQGQDKKLVDVSDAANEGFWMVQNKWLKEKGKNTTIAYFTEFFIEASGTKKLKADRDIKEICAEAYKKESTGSSSPTADDVAKYCTFIKLSAQ